MAKSRCDLCGKRIGPNRYELGLCPGCENLTRAVDAFRVVLALNRMLNDPSFVTRINEMGDGIAGALRAAMGEPGG